MTAAGALADETGRTIVGLGLDVAERASAEAAVAAAVERTGRLDILVNNAGVCFHRPALEVPDEEWRQVFDFNVHGLWTMSQVAARHFAAHGGGVVVNIGSGHRPNSRPKIIPVCGWRHVQGVPGPMAR